MENKKIIEEKLADIKVYLQKLLPLLKADARVIIEDELTLSAVERRFQLIVDTAIDINTHIIKEADINTPDDYQGTFTVLAENKILPMEFALKIAPSVGLRNLIVHKYGKVDIKKMIDDIKNDIGDYVEYIRLISEKFSAN
ncbi:MAG: HepT-like ribonuclease domain-containing protein [Patescibacteria group bacterium]